jgi:predicted RND superfamily exporter protein
VTQVSDGAVNRIEEAVGAGVGRVAVWSTRHAGIVVVVALLVTGVFGFGLSKIYVRSADYDLMPDGHPSTIANQHALSEVPGYRSIETIWMETRPDSGPNGDDHQMNITRPQAIRAAQEVEDYIRARVNDSQGQPAIRYTYSLAYLVKLVNYTLSGVPNPVCNLNPLPIAPPPPFPALPPVPALPPAANGTCVPIPPKLEAFSMPKNDTDVQRNYDIIAQANFGAVQGAVNDKFTGTLVVFMYDFNLTKQGPAAVLPVSERFLHVVEHFKAEDCDKMDIRLADGQSLVNCPHIYVLGEAINAHMTELANQDFVTWGPVVFVVTLLVLLLAFWFDWIATGIAALTFTIGLVWTYGFMGFLGIPLTFFGLLIVPITLGVGKEYAIYVTNQYLEYTAEGRAKEEAFRLVGRRSGAALLIASVTSIVGVATMALAKFFIMRDLAILTCFSFASLFLISITVIPALHALRRRAREPRPFRPVRSMGTWAGWLRGHRVLVSIAVVALTVGAAMESTQIKEYFGISGGFKEGDYLDESYRYYNQVLGGSGTELVVIETQDHGVGDPATIDYLRALDHSFKQDTKTIPKASNVNSLIIALDTYYALRDGLLNPKALSLTAGQSPIPRDRDTVNHDIDANFDSPVWSSLMALFTGRTGNVVVTHVFYKIEGEDYEHLKADWTSLNHDIAPTTVARPSTVTDVNLVGTQDTFYLYVTYGQPWLEYVGYMASFLTLLLAILVVGRGRDFTALAPGIIAFFAWFTGIYQHDGQLIYLAGAAGVLTLLLLWMLRARDVAAIMVPMMLAAVWWAGLLPLFGIKASLTLMLPTVFLISVGSDYAIQYVWNYRQIGSMRKVYESTGKANLFVVAATTIAFLLFVPMKLVLSSQGALAAALAIMVIFLATTVLVPLFYPADKPPARFPATTSSKTT